MTKLIILFALTVNLLGCATPPRFLANMYDNNDTCQQTHLIQTGQYPSWCGASNSKTYITRDYQTGRYLTITK
jgi:hypothetical protein